ncbi:hypothetical protein HHK36_012636 [Tetracentron sinense]|uniref:Vacuole membrane protein 1 n=1 Tax=Tetracentron sinense TaxID=13715 RepID=A0A834Z768_TETSI|nr:hypothetical protein HHK36_012636 [Tetracentron sinense]
MGPGKPVTSPLSSPVPSQDVAKTEISELRKKHQQDLENLTFRRQPGKTLRLFALATARYLKRSIYILAKGGWLMLLSTLIVAFGIVLMIIDGPHEKHVQEILCYLRFGLWWMALGVASSIGLGSGLHTFVLYLGPHIALFTIKAVQCGRVDLKSAPYDTIQLKRGPSWLDRDCSEYEPPVFPSLHGPRVPLSSILPQVQLEAILWGIGTALGELPPYFISRAALMSGGKLDAMEELNASSTADNGFMANHLKQIKCWFLSHSQHLNFFTILVLASVPNPLFDLAGIMCGQFGIPFWKFFVATLIGKAIIKTHIQESGYTLKLLCHSACWLLIKAAILSTFLQTVFIISVCNNQLFDWIENELIWVLGLIPGLASILPNLIAKLHMVKEKYLAAPPVPSNIKVKKWDFSFALIWNTVVWLMLLNFFVKIVTATARRVLSFFFLKLLELLQSLVSSSHPCSDSIQAITHDIKVVCSSISSVVFTFVRRDGNVEAHEIAAKALKSFSEFGSRCPPCSKFVWGPGDPSLLNRWEFPK